MEIETAIVANDERIVIGRKSDVFVYLIKPVVSKKLITSKYLNFLILKKSILFENNKFFSSVEKQ